VAARRGGVVSGVRSGRVSGAVSVPAPGPTRPAGSARVGNDPVDLAARSIPSVAMEQQRGDADPPAGSWSAGEGAGAVGVSVALAPAGGSGLSVAGGPSAVSVPPAASAAGVAAAVPSPNALLGAAVVPSGAVSGAAVGSSGWRPGQLISILFSDGTPEHPDAGLLIGNGYSFDASSCTGSAACDGGADTDPLAPADSPAAWALLAAACREPLSSAVRSAPDTQVTSSATGPGGSLTVNPTVTIVDGIIQGHLQAVSSRGLTMTYTAIGPAAGFDSTLGESGGKISLGTVPDSATTTDPQSYTILPYANWLDGGAKGTQTFSVRVSEVTALHSFLTGVPLVGLVAAPVIDLLQTLPLIGDLLAPLIGASVVARITVDVASLAPADTPVALTYMVTSFDGVGISTNFFPAAGLSAGGRAPTVISMSGLGGGAYSDPYTDRVFDIEGQEYDLPSVGVLRNDGYNVVSATPRGVRNSGGIMQLDNPFFEGRDMSAVIDFIAAQTPATLDGPNDPAVGMVGASYGGGIQLVAAGIDPRIDAITPENTWNSLNASLYPDNTWRTSYGSVLYLALVITGARVNSLVPRAVLTGNLFGWMSQTAQAALASSGPTALLNTLAAPTLLTQGIQEALFPLRQSLDNAENILGNGSGTPVKVAWYCGGHGVCQDPQNPDQKAILLADTLNWLTQYVKRTGTPADAIPNFQWFDQLGGYYFSDKLPFQSGFNDRPDITATSTGGLLPVVPVLGGSNSFFALPYSLGGGSVARNAINVPVEVGPGTQVVGAPAVSITYEGLGTTRAVFAQVVDDSTGRVLGNVVTPVPVTLDGRQHTLTMDLSDIVYTNASADSRTLTVQITSSATAFENFTSFGLMTISDISVTMPNRTV
jgi:ABC-2 type transport system ATP-binding protein